MRNKNEIFFDPHKATIFFFLDECKAAVRELGRKVLFGHALYVFIAVLKE